MSVLENPMCWFKGFFGLFLTIGLAYGLRMLEWPCWQNPEYSLGGEMLLATHDAYHWVAGAENFGLAVGHPMAILLRWCSDLTGASCANAAFWFPAVLASLVAGAVYAWTWNLGSMAVGVAAGLIASIAPGFLARTLLGYYDTDLVTLFFPLVIALGPACWCSCFIFQGNFSWRKPGQTRPVPEHDFFWIGILAFSGLLAWWTQSWHSVFPYIIRCDAVLLILACFLNRRQQAKLLPYAMTWVFPALAGWIGMIFPIAIVLAYFFPKLQPVLQKRLMLVILCLLAVFLMARGDILTTLINHANAYLKHSGDAHSSGGASLVFPSVAQSIIEVQDLSIAALFPYFHPWLEASIVGFSCFFLVLYKRPAAFFLLPLAILGLSSSKLGGRMVMFGAPIVAIGISLSGYWLARWLLRRVNLGRQAGWLTCITLCGFMVAPFIDMIPALSQGPILNRRHAAALTQAGAITPEDATLWLWWDWGYAAHYFARRQTIADGARHGGPSLYLPAAIFATDNPRFARQIIKRASTMQNEPGNFFCDLNAEKAQELINKLKSPSTPLVKGKGKQYIIASFEMLKLGFWISNYGNWNFITCQGEGGAISILPQALAYNLENGEVRLENNPLPIFPASINIFEETGIIKRNYIQEWFAAHPRATAKQQRAWLESRRNINFILNRVTDEKIAMDEGLYNSLMVQLLLRDAGDSDLAPYFKLVYDNVFTRIYEVLPVPEEQDSD